MKTKLSITIYLALAVAGITSAINAPVQADQTSSAARSYRPTTADHEFHSEKLASPVSLPGLPPYTGRSTFLTGLRYPNDSTGQRVGMTFGVTETADQVLEWYRGSLKSYQWTVLPGSSDQNLVAANQGANTLSVRVSPSRSPNFRSEVVISYKFGK